MAVYRVHASSSWSSKSEEKQMISLAKTLQTLVNAAVISNPLIQNAVQKQLASIALTIYRRSTDQAIQSEYFSIAAVNDPNTLRTAFDQKSLGLRVELRRFFTRLFKSNKPRI